MRQFFKQEDDVLRIFVTGICLDRLHERYPVRVTINEHVSAISDFILSYLTENNYNPTKFILDCTMEKAWVITVGYRIATTLKLSNCYFITSIEPDTQANFGDYPYEVDYFAESNLYQFYTRLVDQNIDWRNVIVDYPILSIAGRVTNNRVKFQKGLMDLFSDRARVSLGGRVTSESQLEAFKTLLQPYPFPLAHRLHKQIDDFNDTQHSVPEEGMFKSLINVVHETYGPEQSSIFITEKTHKTFAWHQIPVYYTSLNHAAKVRDLGYDIFDDIIDHAYYDSETDVDRKRTKIFKLLTSFVGRYKTIDDVNQLRSQLFYRLSNNNQLLSSVKRKVSWERYG